MPSEPCPWGIERVRWFAAAAGIAILGGAHASPLPPLAAKYCGSCHSIPAPGALPRENWTQVFGFMSVWIRERNLPFDPGEYTGLLNDYIAQAPERLAPIPDDLAPPGLRFEARAVGASASVARPVVTDLRISDLDGDGRLEILVCDDSAGGVSILRSLEAGFVETRLFEIAAPSRAVPLDYDGDGLTDLAVGSLGLVQPTDQLAGSVWLLRNRGGMEFEPQTLLSGCARVSDVKPGDFNGDGKPDLLVVQFGWRRTGGLLWLEQGSPTEFSSHEIAAVNGALQAETVDYDADGDLDFVALFAQEHESLVLFANDGRGGFSTEVLARGPHPAFGSSGFSMVDLDRDGDRDFLWTNGDMMDEIPLAKPYHGLRWLENRNGTLVPRELARMPGCYRAAAHDLDLDGDLDVAVSSLYPQWEERDFPSLVWLENDGKESFAARRLLHSPANLASLVVGDFDADGLPDLLVGGMHLPGPSARIGRLTGLFGLRREAGAAPPPRRDTR